MKRFLILAFGLLCIGMLEAQNNYITVDLREELTRKVTDLQGKASVVFLSPHEDLVVTTSNASLDAVQPVVKNSDGKYAYEVRLDVSSRRDRNFTLSRRGGALSEEVKNTFRPNTRLYYYVEEVENPIVLNEQGGRGEAHLVNNEACVEFTTSIEGLQADLPEGMPATVKRSKSASGANVISVIVDMTAFGKLRDEAGNRRDEARELDASIIKAKEEGRDVPDTDWDRLAALEKQADEAEARFESVCYLRLHAEKTNELTVSIGDLSVKQKLAYAVLTLKEKVEHYNRSYDQYLGQALQAEKNRKFSTAKDFYRQAAEAEDATEDEKAACQKKVEEMGECDGYVKAANGAIRLLKKMKEQGGKADYNMVEECYNVAINNFQKLNQVRPDDAVVRNIVKLQEARDKVGLVIEGRAIGIESKQGRFLETPITGVDIYGLSYYNEKMMEKGRHGDYLGAVGSDSKFHVEVERNKYKGLLFVPARNEEYKKNAWLPFKEQKHLKVDVRIRK